MNKPEAASAVVEALETLKRNQSEEGALALQNALRALLSDEAETDQALDQVEDLAPDQALDQVEDQAPEQVKKPVTRRKSSKAAA